MESVLGFQSAEQAQAMLQQVFRVLRPGRRFVANEAVWREEVSMAKVRNIYEASISDFGVCQASQQGWHVHDWLNLMEQTGFTVIEAPLLSNLLPEYSDEIPQTVALSDRFTQRHRLRKYLIPRLAWQQWQYRRRLARHQVDGQWIEGRRPGCHRQAGELVEKFSWRRYAVTHQPLCFVEPGLYLQILLQEPFPEF